MADLTFGIDISVYQTNDAANPKFLFDPLLALEKSVNFAFIRASIGTAKDNAVDKFAKSFSAAKMPHGFYHFLRSDVSYQTQADRFIETIKQFEFQLPPVCDVEHNGVGLEMTKAFFGRVTSKLGRSMIIYSSPGFWNGLRGVDKATWALEYDYWVAHYVTLKFPVYGVPDNVINSTKFPAGLSPWKQAGKPWKFWQFCASGDGEFYGGDYARHTNKTSLDLDVFNGDLQAFNAYIGKTTPISDPITPPPPLNGADLAALENQFYLLSLRVKNIEDHLKGFRLP